VALLEAVSAQYSEDGAWQPACWNAQSASNTNVIAGLDPAIHHQPMSYWVYILASAPGGTLYVGVTNDLIRRTYEHREGLVPGFTKKYGVKRLVYYEAHDTAIAAIQREKNIKHWSREWKIDLIVSMNPVWRDLYDEITR
jgi:putative endonuclease